MGLDGAELSAYGLAKATLLINSPCRRGVIIDCKLMKVVEFQIYSVFSTIYRCIKGMRLLSYIFTVKLVQLRMCTVSYSI